MGVSQSLPATAYIKMIDIWMIFCILYPFLIVVLFSLSVVLTKEKNLIKPMKNDNSPIRNKVYELADSIICFILQKGLPFIFYILIFIFCSLGLVNYTWPDVKSLCKK